MFYRKYQRSLRLKACGFSQRAKRSAWKMRQQGAKRVGAPKVRCGFSQRAKRSAWKMRQQGAKRVGAPKVRCGFPRLQPVRKMRQQGAQRVGAPKVHYPQILKTCPSETTGCGKSPWQRSPRSLLRLRLKPCPNLEALSQRTGELRKASCKHRSALARAFLSQAMPGPTERTANRRQPVGV